MGNKTNREAVHDFADLTHYEPPEGFSDDDTNDVIVNLDAGEGEDLIRQAEAGFKGEADDDNDDDLNDLDHDRNKLFADDDQGEDDNEDDLSQKMRKRLARKDRKHKKETDDLREQLEAGNKRLSELERKSQDTETRAEQRERQREMDIELERLETELAEAIENGDSTGQAKAQTEIARTTAQFQTGTTESTNDSADTGTRKGAGSDENPLLDSWMRENSHWYGKEGKRRESREVQNIQDELIEEGYTVETNAFFDELVARHSKKYPKLIRGLNGRTANTVDDDLSDEDEEADARRGGRKAEVEHTDRGGNRKTAGRTRRTREYRLTAEDRTQMRTFGLDPENPSAVKHFVSEKVKG